MERIPIYLNNPYTGIMKDATGVYIILIDLAYRRQILL